MRIGWFLSLESLQLFVVEEGLNPEVVVHPKSLELLGQREVGKNYIMNLGRNKSVFYQNEDQICYDTCCPVSGNWTCRTYVFL